MYYVMEAVARIAIALSVPLITVGFRILGAAGRALGWLVCALVLDPLAALCDWILKTLKKLDPKHVTSGAKMTTHPAPLSAADVAPRTPSHGFTATQPARPAAAPALTAKEMDRAAWGERAWQLYREDAALRVTSMASQSVLQAHMHAQGRPEGGAHVRAEWRAMAEELWLAQPALTPEQLVDALDVAGVLDVDLDGGAALNDILAAEAAEMLAGHLRARERGQDL